MKISNILIALIMLISVACSSNNSNDEHGHEHDTEDNGHSHDDDNNHNEQEEFILNEDSAATKSEKIRNEQESVDSYDNQENEISLVVPANKGIEYKFYIKQYEKLIYEWTAEAPLYFDFHGEPLDYDVTKYFESYTIAIADEMKGTMTIPFEGSHGWYWKNNSNKEVVVTLKTQGKYKISGLRK